MTETSPIVGVVGGIAPPSTIQYYRLLMDGYQQRRGAGSQPRILVNSIDLQHMLRLVDATDRGALVDFLVVEVERLRTAGATIGLFSSNVPHLVFDQVAARTTLPLVSIVAAVAAEISSRGWKKVGLLGTRFTMSGGFYQAALGRAGITVVLPPPAEQEAIHQRYIDEFTQGRFTSAARDMVANTIGALRARGHVDAVVLAGTELPLAVGPADVPGIELLDSAQVHVNAVLDVTFGAIATPV